MTASADFSSGGCASCHEDAVLKRFVVVAACLLTARVIAQVNAPLAERVVVIGVDGLSPDGIRIAGTPHLDRLMARGAWTLAARAVIPTVSSPNWASILMGAGPSQHGVTSNDWNPQRHDVAPVVMGPGGIFPTIVGVLREQRPGAVIGVFHDWDGFGRLFERDSADVVEDVNGPDAAGMRASTFVRERNASLTFVHLDHVDHAGHEHGWTSPEYYRAVEHADRVIGTLLSSSGDDDLARTFVLVTSDHGGLGTRHGGITMAEILIPWIAAGPGVRRGVELTAPVSTTDTAATLAHVLGIRPHSAWTGRVVTAAFSGLRED
jgi:predicted AlkP superfamily pyrophosphatase or phosphodiesterase